MATTLAFPLVSNKFLQPWKKLPDTVVKDIQEMVKEKTILPVIHFQDPRMNGPDFDNYFEQRRIGRTDSDSDSSEDNDDSQRLAYYIEDGY